MRGRASDTIQESVTVDGGGDYIGRLIQEAPDPDPALAIKDPGRLLAYLYVSPRPCAAFDRILRCGPRSEFRVPHPRRRTRSGDPS